ncbi:hypothetical protein LAG90_01460 [Marinilongibacter aquaticus]|uniref:hypothetical protein n=1 Tax=Marinilongibacter aquaticus TaxID=2975157 RepID=UPI0021BDAE2F|nr:hypothetical protein [Marinilongibacter aquaticus]UBM59324.1 hypothetical protein LAG90_01460 [Marinilongibacter aquaticus]
MKRVLGLVFFGLVWVSTGYGQYVDKGAWYMSIVDGQAAKSYANYLKSNEIRSNRVGFVAGYLFNPMTKSNVNSPVQIGAEFGILSWGSEKVDNYFGGDFEAKYGSTWLNAVARYRPVLDASKINPFFDIFFGPEFRNTRIIEKLDDATATYNGQTSKVFKQNTVLKNYGIGAGVGIKYLKKNGSLRYVDIGLYYKHAEKAKMIARNSFYIDRDGQIFYDEKLVRPASFQLRVGLTGFL